MTKYVCSNELMKNQQAARALPPGAKLEAAQTSDGHALLFSIGDDGVLYLQVEQSSTKTGWLSTDLSSELAVENGWQSIRAKDFDVTQNGSSGEITIAVAIHVDDLGADAVFLLTGLSDAPDAAWYASQDAREWFERPYDDTEHPVESLDVAYLALAKNNSPYSPKLLVGLRETNDYIQNYTVDTYPGDTTDLWQIFETAENYDTLLGLGMGATAGSMGLYQLYSASGAGTGLSFTPFEGLFGPPTVTKLTAPDGASSLAVVPIDANNDTDLYVAGEGAIYRFANREQQTFATGTPIITSDLLTGVGNLFACSSDSRVVLWGLNADGQVFYSACSVDEVGDPAAWSQPIAILQGVEQLSPLLNLTTGGNELFAHVAGNLLLRLFQDPVTSLWQERGVLLPALADDDVVETYTYTTQITITDEDNLPVAGAAIGLSSINGPAKVLVDGRYRTLTPDNPVTVTSDATGVVTIVQQTTDLSTVPYLLEKDDGTTEAINPMNAILAKLDGIQTGDDLTAIEVTDEEGNTQPLIPPGTDPVDVDAIAQALNEFVQAGQTLPADGAVSTAAPTTEAAVELDTRRPALWGMTFRDGKKRFYRGEEAMAALGLERHAGGRLSIRSPTLELDDVGDAIVAAAGDVLRWAEDAIEDVVGFFVEVVEGAYNFFIQIAGDLYTFVITCIGDLLSAIEFLFQTIVVAIETLVQWLGFIFAWGDVLRTKDALKNIIRLYLDGVTGEIEPLKKGIGLAFDNIEEAIDQWAGLEDQQGSIASYSAASSGVPGQNSPPAQWGNYQFKTNVDGASVTVDKVPDTSSDQLAELFSELAAALEQEGDIFKQAADTIVNDILSQITTMSVGELIEQLLAVLATVLVESIENVIDTFLDILQILIQGLPAVLEAPINIPVLSWLYQEISGDQLTLLDLGCLVAAVPGTVLFKIVKGRAPFPDDEFTQEVISAESWPELRQLYSPASSFAVIADDYSADASQETLEDLIFVLHLVAGVCGFVFTLLSTLKIVDKESKAISVFQGVFFYLTTAPNFAASLIASPSQSWDKVVNETVYAITCLQKFVDIYTYRADMKAWSRVTPWLDSILGVCGVISPIASLFQKVDGWTVVSFLDSSCWNLNRFLSPGAKIDHPMIVSGKMVLIIYYSVLQFVLVGDTGDV